MTTPDDITGLTDEALIESLRDICGINRARSLRGLSKCCEARCTVVYSKAFGMTLWGQAHGMLHCSACQKPCKRYQHKGKNPQTGWDPLTDWNHTMEVVERVRELQLLREFVQALSMVHSGFNFPEWGDKWSDWFYVFFGPTKGNSQRAICLAALQAVRSSHV